MEENEEIIDIGDDEVVEGAIQAVNLTPHEQPPNEVSEQSNEAFETASDVQASESYHFQDMDDESRILIEQMLAEEEYYYGRDTLSTLPSATKSKTTGKRKKRTKDMQSPAKKLKSEGSTVSSAALPSHKTRWTESEDSLLRAAIDEYGYGNWKKIAAHVKTRNPLQCKNRARHWVLTEKLQKQPVSAPKNTRTAIPNNNQPIVDHRVDSGSTAVEEDDESDEISVEDGDDTPAFSNKPLPAIDSSNIGIPEVDVTTEPNDGTPSDHTFVEVKDNNEVPANEANRDIAVTEEIVEKRTSPQILGNSNVPLREQCYSMSDGHVLKNESPQNTTLAMNEPVRVLLNQEAPTASDILGNNPQEITPYDIDYGNSHSNSATAMQEETSEIHFDRSTISEEEKSSNPEWFQNKQSKTPERYLKIRNHILDSWRACRPRYLTKTAARRNLRDCGDVNAIGRVHAYLESIGAINVNCVNDAPRPPKRVARELDEEEPHSEMFSAADLVIGYEGPRKRRVRNEHGEWVDPRELEGRVIEHGKKQEEKAAKPKRIIKRPRHYSGDDDFGRGYDPFRLVPLEHYDEEYSAPFLVEVTSDALLIMDFHSHLAHTEIIGLLGGKFYDKQDVKVLKIESVFPCKSTSTGIQCEMDPASEMKAREVFAEKGYSVVGWYHSHPTFEPHPSIRDIENQTSYQTLFRHEDTGDEPFIGVIVSPYDPEAESEHSKIQYLHISPRWNETHLFRIPYACRKSVQQSEQVSHEVLDQFRSLIEEYKNYEHKVDMMHPFGSQTRLDKLLESLRANLFLPADDVTLFLDLVRRLVVEEFVITVDAEKKPATKTPSQSESVTTS